MAQKNFPILTLEDYIIDSSRSPTHDLASSSGSDWSLLSLGSSRLLTSGFRGAIHSTNAPDFKPPQKAEKIFPTESGTSPYPWDPEPNLHLSDPVNHLESNETHGRKTSPLTTNSAAGQGPQVFPTGQLISSEEECYSRRDAPRIDWAAYRRYLLRVWEENSLDNSSLDSESSTLPSMSSISGDLPFAFDLLSQELLPEGEGTTKVHSLRKKNSLSHEVVPNVVVSIPEKPMKPSTFQPRSTQVPHLQRTPPSPYPQGGHNFHPPDRREVALPDGLTTTTTRIVEAPSFEKRNYPQGRPSGMTHPLQRQKSRSLSPSARNKSSGVNHLSSPNQRKNLRGKPCLVHGGEIATLKNDIKDAQKTIQSLSAQMEDKFSHLQKLIEERNSLKRPFEEFPPLQTSPGMSYPVFPQGYKPTAHTMYPSNMNYGYNAHHALGRRPSWQPCDSHRGRIPGDLRGMEAPGDLDPRALENLRDRIVALQMQNIELNLFLKKEEVRRKEAEDAVRREKDYVKKLQNSLQDLSTSTLVMDPQMYQQVADKYIAARKKPVRRTHTCNPYLGSSDLVCDSSRLQVTQNANQSSSCPSSPLGSKQGRKNTLMSIPSREEPLQLTPAPSETLRDESNSLPSNNNAGPSSANWSIEAERGASSTLNSKEYEDLLQSLDGMGVKSTPP